MQDIAEEVIEQVSFDLAKLLVDYIDMFVYKYEYFPNQTYYKGSGKPTYEFRKAWKISKIKPTVKGITQEIYYDWQSMSYDPDTWKHGSNVPGWPQDAREQLADWLNVTGYTSGLSLNGTRPLSKLRMPYFDIWTEKLFDKNEIRNRLDKEFKSYGIVRTR